MTPLLFVLLGLIVKCACDATVCTTVDCGCAEGWRLKKNSNDCVPMECLPVQKSDVNGSIYCPQEGCVEYEGYCYPICSDSSSCPSACNTVYGELCLFHCPYGYTTLASNPQECFKKGKGDASQSGGKSEGASDWLWIVFMAITVLLAIILIIVGSVFAYNHNKNSKKDLKAPGINDKSKPLSKQEVNPDKVPSSSAKSLHPSVPSKSQAAKKNDESASFDSQSKKSQNKSNKDSSMSETTGSQSTSQKSQGSSKASGSDDGAVENDGGEGEGLEKGASSKNVKDEEGLEDDLGVGDGEDAGDDGDADGESFQSKAQNEETGESFQPKAAEGVENGDGGESFQSKAGGDGGESFQSNVDGSSASGEW